jgi:hypothetical protein
MLVIAAGLGCIFGILMAAIAMTLFVCVAAVDSNND